MSNMHLINCFQLSELKWVIHRRDINMFSENITFLFFWTLIGICLRSVPQMVYSGRKWWRSSKDSCFRDHVLNPNSASLCLICSVGSQNRDWLFSWDCLFDWCCSWRETDLVGRSSRVELFDWLCSWGVMVSLALFLKLCAREGVRKCPRKALAFFADAGNMSTAQALLYLTAPSSDGCKTVWRTSRV